MKKLIAALLCVCVLLAFTACGGAQEAQTDYPPEEILQRLLDSQEELPAMMNTLNMGADGFANHLLMYYNMEEALFEDGALSYDDGTSATEFAVLKLGEETDGDFVRDMLLEYIELRIEEFFGYAPAEVFMLEQAAVESGGGYVALIICDGMEQAQSAFADCFGGASAAGDTLQIAATLSYSAAGSAGNTYDGEAVLRAWRTGDRSGLSGKNLRILEVCENAIGELITETMQDHEKELAIHDWIIQWADYDMETKSRSVNARPNPDNDNPYGLLIGRRAICTGYAATFQLMMDMVGVECITVQGTANRTANEHMWNMVRLDDGEWYCVDVTWNDPVGLDGYDAEIQHRYYNVTSDVMADSFHFWDESAVPEANGTLYAWQ